MSTKCSIAYDAKRFHFYEECMDEQFVYLEQYNVEFQVNQNSIMVAIPVEVMDKIVEKWLKIREKI